MNWIEQHQNNFKKYPDKKFYRVIDDGSEIPEWSDYDNVKQSPTEICGVEWLYK